MDQLTWKSKARLVIYYQLLYLCLSLSLIILFGIVLCTYTFPNSKTGISKELKPHCACAQEPSSRSNYSRVQNHVKVKTGPASNGEVHVYWVAGVPISNQNCWIIYIVFVIVTVIQLGAFGDLWEATKTGTAPKKAIDRAMEWVNAITGFLSIGFFIQTVLFCSFFIISGPLRELCLLVFVAFGVDFWVKYQCLCVVNKFIDELQKPSRGRTAV